MIIDRNSFSIFMSILVTGDLSDLKSIFRRFEGVFFNILSDALTSFLAKFKYGDKSLSFKGIYKIYRKKALLLIIFNLSYF